MLVYFFGFIHAISLFLISLGSFEQLLLIRESQTRTQDNPSQRTSQLSVQYRGNASCFFIVIILWGLSLEPIDWIVIISRFFAYIISILILHELWLDRRDIYSKYYLLICLNLTGFGLISMLFSWDSFKNMSSFLGTLTLIFSFTLIGGLIDKTYQIIEAKSPGKQCLVEIVFQLIKDWSGIIYGLLVGFKTMWPLVIALYILSIIRFANLLVYLYFSKKSIKRKAKIQARSRHG
ncbi:MAG: hypothetical protein AB4290_04000 [Spirulina sp.]